MKRRLKWWRIDADEYIARFTDRTLIAKTDENGHITHIIVFDEQWRKVAEG